jgi:hypothetical protein
MFLCELIHAGEPVKGQRYPKVVMSLGTPPGEHSRMDAALLPGNSLEEEDMREEAEEIYDANEDMGHSEDGDEEHDEFGHSEDDGMSGHEELPEDYH